MGYDRKYGWIALELKPEAPVEEPMFVLRGQDRLAAVVVRMYARLYLSATGDVAGYTSILDQAISMEAWPTRKLPD